MASPHPCVLRVCLELQRYLDRDQQVREKAGLNTCVNSACYCSILVWEDIVGTFSSSPETNGVSVAEAQGASCDPLAVFVYRIVFSLPSGRSSILLDYHRHPEVSTSDRPVA